MSTLLVRPMTGTQLIGVQSVVSKGGVTSAGSGQSIISGQPSKNARSSSTVADSLHAGSLHAGSLTMGSPETGTLEARSVGEPDSTNVRESIRGSLLTSADVSRKRAEKSLPTLATATLATAEPAAGEEASLGPDTILVERAQRGDSEAYRELVERYQRRALAISVGLLGNQEDARDLVQQAFLKAYRSLGSFRGQSSFYTWLYRILVNLSIDFSRKAYRRSEQGFDDANLIDAYAQRSTASPDDYLGHLDSPEQRVHRTELRGRLESALAALSSEHRTVIILREIEGLSYSEISDAVGCSKGTVMSRLHHARKRLQRALEDIRPVASRGAVASRSESDSEVEPGVFEEDL